MFPPPYLYLFTCVSDGRRPETVYVAMESQLTSLNLFFFLSKDARRCHNMSPDYNQVYYWVFGGLSYTNLPSVTFHFKGAVWTGSSGAIDSDRTCTRMSKRSHLSFYRHVDLVVISVRSYLKGSACV